MVYTERMTETTFDLLAPTSGQGPTHLRTPGRGGILCGDYTRRYATFTQAGIVRPGDATCKHCNQQARDIVARQLAR